MDALQEKHSLISQEEKQLKEVTESCIEKLKAMSDAEYLGMELDSVLDLESE